MQYLRYFVQQTIFASSLLLLFLATACANKQGLESIQLPEGFQIEILVDDVDNARQMALSEPGTLFVGTRRAGNVYAVSNALTGTGSTRVIAEGLEMPSGIALHEGNLYVGAVNRILKFTDIDAQLNTSSDPPKFQVITQDLPDKQHHGWKYLRFGPDGALYVPVGAPCNICLSEDPRFASILRMNPSDGSTTVFASGIRNTVGLAFNPINGHLWFTDNGRDMLDDDTPSEELNIATEAGQHFGYPFIHSVPPNGFMNDPEFGANKRAADYRAPAVRIQAHSAPLGLTFYNGRAFPARYRHGVFIAEHGSWNRSKKVGYQVSFVNQTASGEFSYEPFATGWLQGQNDWGRPNDVLQTPNGALLISDDKAGVVYRVRFVGE